MPKEIGNSVWPPEDQTNPQKSLARNSVKYPWSLREMRCLPVKCSVYPRKAMFTRGKEQPHATTRIYSNVLLWCFLVCLTHLVIRMTTAPKFLDWPLLKHLSHGVFCLQDWVWGDLGQNARSHANIYVSLSENIYVNTILWENLCQMWFKVISHEFD